MTTDHAHYIYAVAAHLDKAGFHVLSVRRHEWERRGGHIVLGCQDGWSDYSQGDADLCWDETNGGWSIKWGGITTVLGLPHVAPPAVVAMVVGHHVGQTPLPVDGETFDRVDAKPGTPEFDAALAAYNTERTPR